MKYLLFEAFAIMFVLVLAAMGLSLIYNAIDLYRRRRLEEALVKLGWVQDECDSWRNRRTGIIVGFQDAVTMELHAHSRIMRIFGGRYFKEPN